MAIPFWLLLSAVSVAAGAQGDETAQLSLRSREYLRFDCASAVGRRELTLFGNGTVRLREGLRNEEVLRLLELGPDELDAYLARLTDEDLRESERFHSTVSGQWVERCTLDLALPGGVPETYYFGRYDTLSLQLQRVVGIALELVDRVGERPPEGADQLPVGYEPRPGDLLRRVDGAFFEVVGLTADKLGVELLGKDQPLTIYIPIGELNELFVALESRRR